MTSPECAALDARRNHAQRNRKGSINMPSVNVLKRVSGLFVKASALARRHPLIAWKSTDTPQATSSAFVGSIFRSCCPNASTAVFTRSHNMLCGPSARANQAMQGNLFVHLPSSGVVGK